MARRADLFWPVRVAIGSDCWLDDIGTCEGAVRRPAHPRWQQPDGYPAIHRPPARADPPVCRQFDRHILELGAALVDADISPEILRYEFGFERRFARSHPRSRGD